MTEVNGIDVINKLRALRHERDQLKEELTQTFLSDSEHAQAKDGVDYRYMRAVRIQSIDRKVDAIKRANIKAV